eukprot:jgi/Mesvir1/9229/Mv03052-RA.1
MMRAEELYRDLRRQGSKPGAPPSQGPSYLDQLRRVVTEMGNALGFLDPPLPHGSFAAGARDAGFSPECLQAARNLDAVVRGLLSPEQFSRSTSGGNNPGAATPGGAVPGGSSATGVQPSAPAASITGAGSVASSCSPGASSSSGSGAVTSGVGSGRPSGASPGHGMTSSGLTTTSASRLPGSSSSSSIASTDSSTEGAPSGIPRSGGDAPGQPSRDGAGAGAGTGTALAAAPEAASSSETYFQSLAGVFAEELRKESHLHMRLFLPLVPALTLSFVEDASAWSYALFSDDGFALGLVYMLKVLSLEDSFDSLHWFASTADHFASERAAVSASEEELRGSKGSRGGWLGMGRRANAVAVAAPPVQALEDGHSAQMVGGRMGVSIDSSTQLYR